MNNTFRPKLVNPSPFTIGYSIAYVIAILVVAIIGAVRILGQGLASGLDVNVFALYGLAGLMMWGLSAFAPGHKIFSGRRALAWLVFLLVAYRWWEIMILGRPW